MQGRSVIAGLIAAALVAVGDARAQPQRVMSLTECTDQLLLALLPAERITSVTWLSRDPSGSVMAKAAARTRINHGAVEEVMRDKPDLVVTDPYTPPATRALLQRLGYAVLQIRPAESFEDIRVETRRLALAVGEKARAEALIAHMDAVLHDVAARSTPRVTVAAWDGSGFAAQKGGLYDAILTAAGVHNIADDPGFQGADRPSVEALLAVAPDLLVRGEARFDPPGRQADLAFHPVVRRYWASRTVIVPQSAYLCGTPFSADAALALQTQIQTLAAVARHPLPFSKAPRR